MKKASKKKQQPTATPQTPVQSHFDKWRQMEDFARNEASSYTMRRAIGACLGSIADLVSQDSPSQDYCEWKLAYFFGGAFRGFELFNAGMERNVGSVVVGTPQSKVLDLIEAVKYALEHSIRVDIPVQPNEVRRALDESGLPAKPWVWMRICDEFDQKAEGIAGGDGRKQMALDLWNAGDLTWAEIASKIHDDSGWKPLSEEIKRYAKSTQQPIRRGKPGLRKGTEQK